MDRLEARGEADGRFFSPAGGEDVLGWMLDQHLRLAGNMVGVAALLRKLGLSRVALLPYNPLWIDKRKELGLPVPYRHDRFMDRAEVERCRGTTSAQGIIEVTV